MRVGALGAATVLVALAGGAAGCDAGSTAAPSRRSAVVESAAARGGGGPSRGAERTSIEPAPRGAAAEGASSAEAPGGARLAGLAYVERVTAGSDPSRPLPLIVAVHGLGDTPEGFIELFAGLRGAARVLAPRGPTPHGSGASWFFFERGRRAEELAAGIAVAAERVTEFVKVAVRVRPTRGKPCLMGFSQGGMVSFAVTALHPELLRAVFPIGGMLPGTLLPGTLLPASIAESARPSLRAFHGSADAVVPVAGAREAVTALRRLGFSAELEEYEGVGHAVPPLMRQHLLESLEERCVR